MRKEKGNQKLNAFFPSLLKFEYMEAIAHKHVYFTYSHGSISSYFFSMFTKELIVHRRIKRFYPYFLRINYCKSEQLIIEQTGISL